MRHRSHKQTGLILHVERVFQTSSKDLGRAVDDSISLSRVNQTPLLRIEDRLIELQKTQSEFSTSLKKTEEYSDVPQHPWLEYTPLSPRGDQRIEPCHRTRAVELATNSAICFKASVRHECARSCRCRCHKTTSIASPRYLQGAIGAFFFSYNARAVFGNATCDFTACNSTPRSRLQVYYHFSAWLLSHAIFSMSCDTLSTGASLYFKVPRVIKSHDAIWGSIRGGHLD
jgi:hypothetical protein